ncbi:predicted protein [Sclerotinia sclerotiorum 1980 UF-70]|uniref:Uncharacterized protein n=1 Tax=Sclerotinia sclerotiorum (strain ATCC 18683 / 1980 / Ss-1) TaxID=665079 RepID=A7EX94_SCLS1|nr:predicted protein [Sclerotinia sclerotiorum 1980 UF-70]EDN94086.1 predicted protein [Sclerotinia sclerotiorum 1980 UF-70]
MIGILDFERSRPLAILRPAVSMFTPIVQMFVGNINQLLRGVCWAVLRLIPEVGNMLASILSKAVLCFVQFVNDPEIFSLSARFCKRWIALGEAVLRPFTYNVSLRAMRRQLNSYYSEIRMRSPASFRAVPSQVQCRDGIHAFCITSNEPPVGVLCAGAHASSWIIGAGLKARISYQLVWTTRKGWMTKSPPIVVMVY